MFPADGPLPLGLTQPRERVAELAAEGISQASVVESIRDLKIELVLTAHPTEITRRTLIHKHTEIGQCLAQLELEGLTERERERLHMRLRELIAQIWYGDDFRAQRPSPVDEAKWGFAVVEDSLWRAVPEYLRRLDTALYDNCAVHLPLDAAPVSFVSWMGGDRDGNPNVTAQVTREVLLLSRWQAADLYLADVVHLVEELSMTSCSPALRELAGDAHEPYRAILRSLRDLLGRDPVGYRNVQLERRNTGGGGDPAQLLSSCGGRWRHVIGPWWIVAWNLLPMAPCLTCCAKCSALGYTWCNTTFARTVPGIPGSCPS